MTDLLQQRSMLLILVGACTTAQTAFEAADNIVDRQLLADLGEMIERSHAEIEKLNDRIAADSSPRAADIGARGRGAAIDGRTWD